MLLPQLERAEPHWLHQQHELNGAKLSLQPPIDVVVEKRQNHHVTMTRRLPVKILPQKQPPLAGQISHQISNSIASSDLSLETLLRQQLEQAEIALQHQFNVTGVASQPSVEIPTRQQSSPIPDTFLIQSLVEATPTQKPQTLEKNLSEEQPTAEISRPASVEILPEQGQEQEVEVQQPAQVLQNLQQLVTEISPARELQKKLSTKDSKPVQHLQLHEKPGRSTSGKIWYKIKMNNHSTANSY